MAIITVDKNGVERSQLVWIRKTRGYTYAGTRDIMLSVNRGSGKVAGEKDRVSVHFYNKVNEQIAPGNYILFAIDGDRLYMQAGEEKEAFKISSSAKSSKFAQVSDPVFVDWVRNRIGNYSLYQDSKSGLYYIEAKELKV